MKNHFITGLVTALLNVLVITVLSTLGFLDGDNGNYLIFSSTSLFLLVGIFSTIQKSIMNGTTDTKIISNFKVGLKPVLFFLIGTLTSLFIYLKYINPEFLPNKNRERTEAQISNFPYDEWVKEHPRKAEKKNKEEYEADFVKSNENFLSIQFGLSVMSIILLILSILYSFLASILITQVIIKRK